MNRPREHAAASVRRCRAASSCRLALAGVVLSGLLAACGPAHFDPRTPAAKPAGEPAPPPAGSVEASADGPACTDEVTLAGAFTGPGQSETAVLRLCTLGAEYPHGEEAAAEGFVAERRSASLQLRGAQGETILDEMLDEWTDGWEWGTRWQVCGLFPLGSTGASALVLVRSAYTEGAGLEPRSARLTLYGATAEAFQSLWETSANDIDCAVAPPVIRVTRREHVRWARDDEPDAELGPAEESGASGEITRSETLELHYVDGLFEERPPAAARP